jgi:hypothetical protein
MEGLAMAEAEKRFVKIVRNKYKMDEESENKESRSEACRGASTAGVKDDGKSIAA